MGRGGAPSIATIAGQTNAKLKKKAMEGMGINGFGSGTRTSRFSSVAKTDCGDLQGDRTQDSGMQKGKLGNCAIESSFKVWVVPFIQGIKLTNLDPLDWKLRFL